MTPVKRRYTFWINLTEAKGLRQVKAREGITESEQIRRAIRNWLQKKGVKAKTGRKRAGTRKHPLVVNPGSPGRAA